MSVNTNNIYGSISISDETIAKVASQISLDCYGIVEMFSRDVKDLNDLLVPKNAFSKGVRVVSNGDVINLDLYVVVKFGVSLAAVAETLKNTVKYNVEKFTGMIVDRVNVNVKGVKL